MFLSFGVSLVAKVMWVGYACAAPSVRIFTVSQWRTLIGKIGAYNEVAQTRTPQLNTSTDFLNKTAPDASNATGNLPKSYLTIVFFNERFEFVSEGSMALRVSQQGNNASSLVLSNINPHCSYSDSDCLGCWISIFFHSGLCTTDFRFLNGL